MNFAALALSFIMPGMLFAQRYEQEERVPGREAEIQRALEKTAEEAAKRKEVEGEEVTYEQVLADPDNIDLNYRYARNQILKGNLKGAAATLERMLLIKPELAKVRFFYAIVLFRLDDLAEAEREFNALAALPKTEAIRAEIESYLRQIQSRRQKNHLDARLSVGFQYDSNRNASPSSGQRLFFDIPFTLTGSGLRKVDTSILTIGSINFAHDLGAQTGNKLLASLDYYRADQTAVRFLNLLAYSATLSGVYRTPWGDITPTGFFSHILLHENTYLRMRGGRLQFDHKLSPALNAFLAGQYAYHDYVPTPDAPFATDQTGNEIAGLAGGDWTFIPTMRLSLNYTHAHKNAVQNFWAYERDLVTVSHAWLLGHGFFLVNSATGEFDRYRGADPSVSANIRRDKILWLRTSFGTPLALLASFLKDMVMTLNYEYYGGFSNLTNYTFNNHKTSAMLSYRWSL